MISARKKNGEAATTNNSSLLKQNGGNSDHFSPFPDPSVSGVELVELKSIQSKSSMDKLGKEKVDSEDASKDPLLLVDTRSTRSWSSLPFGSAAAAGSHIDRSASGGEWGDMLDYFSRKKKQTLAPENFENMWSKGRDYNGKDTQITNHVHPGSSIKRSDAVNSSKVFAKQKERHNIASAERGVILPGSNVRPQSETMYISADSNMSTPPPLTSDEDDEEQKLMETELLSSSQSSSGDEEDRVTGLDSPTTKVWDGRTNRSSGVSHIRHPLEGLEGKKGKKGNRGQYQKLHRQQSGRKRSRLGSQKVPLWQEVERTNFLPGDGKDVHPLKPNVKDDDSSDDYDMEIVGRLQSGTTASSSASSLPGSFTSTVNSPQTAFLDDTFFKLRCEVVKVIISY